MRFYGECRFAPCSQSARLAVRHGLETIYHEPVHGARLWRESFAPDAWLPFAPENVPTFQLEHDGDDVGRIVAVAPFREWHVASFVVDDGPLNARARELIKPGARVSVGCHAIRSDENPFTRVVRHRVAQLEHIALVDDGIPAGHIGAVVTKVWDPPAAAKRSSAAGWRALLPPGWELLRDIPGFAPERGLELLGPGNRPVYRWTGEKFAAVR